MAELIRTTRGGQVAIDDRFAMWPDYDLEVRNDSTVDYDLLLSVRYGPSEDRVQLRSLQIVQRRSGPEVSGTGLRTLRLQDYVRATRVEVAHTDAHGRVTDYDEFDRLIARERDDAARWRENRLRWVHRVYRTAQLALRDPAAEVQRRLSLPPSTATRWIREARDAGVFDSFDGLTRVAGETTTAQYAPQVMRIRDEVLHGDG